MSPACAECVIVVSSFVVVVKMVLIIFNVVYKFRPDPTRSESAASVGTLPRIRVKHRHAAGFRELPKPGSYSPATASHYLLKQHYCCLDASFDAPRIAVRFSPALDLSRHRRFAGLAARRTPCRRRPAHRFLLSQKFRRINYRLTAPILRANLMHARRCWF